MSDRDSGLFTSLPSQSILVSEKFPLSNFNRKSDGFDNSTESDQPAEQHGNSSNTVETGC